MWNLGIRGTGRDEQHLAVELHGLPGSVKRFTMLCGLGAVEVRSSRVYYYAHVDNVLI
jgi:hypothetical protein